MHTNKELYDYAEAALVQKYMFEDFFNKFFNNFQYQINFEKKLEHICMQ